MTVPFSGNTYLYHLKEKELNAKDLNIDLNPVSNC